MKNITYSIFDDFKGRLYGLKHCLRDISDHKFLLKFHEKKELFKELKNNPEKPDCLLISYPFKPDSYLLIKEVSKKFKVKIIVVLHSQESEERRIDFIEQGASGIHSMEEDFGVLISMLDIVRNEDYIFNNFFTPDMLNKLRQRKLYKHLNDLKIYDDKNKKIVNMRFQGYEYEDIAKEVGKFDKRLYHVKALYSHVEYLARLVSHRPKAKEIDLIRHAIDHGVIEGYCKIDNFFNIQEPQKRTVASSAIPSL